MTELSLSAKPFSVPSRPRWRRRLLFVLLILVVVFVGTYVILTMVSDRQLQEAFAEADRLDPGWCLENLDAARATATVADEENAALTIQAVIRLVPIRWPAWDYPMNAPPEVLPPPAAENLPPPELLPPPAVGEQVAEADHKEEPPTLRDADPAANKLADNNFRQELVDVPCPQQFTEAQAARLRSEVIRGAQALQQASRLADQPHSHIDISWSKDWASTLPPLQYLQDARVVAGYLEFDVLFRAQGGDLSGALRSCRAILNISNFVGEYPTSNGQMLCIAIRRLAIGRFERVLAQGELAPAELTEWQARLQAEDERLLLLIGARGERAGWDRFYEALQNGDVKLSTAMNGPRPTIAGGRSLSSLRDGIQPDWIVSVPGTVTQSRAAALRIMNRFVEICKLPPEEQAAPLKQLENEVKQAPFLVPEVVSGTFKLAKYSWRTHAQVRCTYTALAVERYRQQHGIWPQELADLVPAFLPAVPKDPFDGQPLRYRHDRQGVVVYSVGSDGKDNGGDFQTLNTYKDGTDIGFRLWDVSRRRQPPPSEK